MIALALVVAARCDAWAVVYTPHYFCPNRAACPLAWNACRM